MSRVVKYDILRVAACFSIVLLHVSASYWSVVDVQGRDFLVMTVYNSVTRFAVPVFFMLSGLFLVAPERKNVTVGKRVLKLVLLFYVWSAFYAFQGIAVDTLRGEFSMEVFRAAVERFVFGHIHNAVIPILIRSSRNRNAANPASPQTTYSSSMPRYSQILIVLPPYFFPFKAVSDLLPESACQTQHAYFCNV